MSEAALKPSAKTQSLAFLIILAAWIVPGLGHLLLKRWRRALIFFFSVAILALAGYWMRGNVFGRHSTDAFDLLGYLADIASGIFFFLGKVFEPGGADVSRAAGDYGTRMIASAGIVNILCVLDAFEIAMGRKS